VLCGLWLGGSGGGCTFGAQVLENPQGRYQESLRQAAAEELLRGVVGMRYSEGLRTLKIPSADGPRTNLIPADDNDCVRQSLTPISSTPSR